MPTRVFQPVPKTVELTVQGTLSGELVENKFYAEGVSAITSVMVAALAAVVDSWVHSNFINQLPPDYTYTRTIARDLSVEASFESIDNTNAGDTGQLSGAGFANNVSLAIHRDTGLSGKKAKSRVYWPGISSSSNNGPNLIQSTSGTAMVGILNALRGDIIADTSNTWKYGYVQRVLNGSKLAIGNFIEVFGHSLVDLILDSQRARLPGHGL